MSKSSFSIREKLGSNFEFLHLPWCGGRGTPTLSLSRIPNVYSSHFIFPSSSFLRNTIIWILRRGEGEEWLDSPSLSPAIQMNKDFCVWKGLWEKKRRRRRDESRFSNRAWRAFFCCCLIGGAHFSCDCTHNGEIAFGIFSFMGLRLKSSRAFFAGELRDKKMPSPSPPVRFWFPFYFRKLSHIQISFLTLWFEFPPTSAPQFAAKKLCPYFEKSQ